MLRHEDPKFRPRPRVEREEELNPDEHRNERRNLSEIRKSDPQSVAKSVHTTISKDWTDQEALEGQRLVALQEKSELNTPLSPPLLLDRGRHGASVVKFKQDFLYANQLIAHGIRGRATRLCAKSRTQYLPG